MVVTALDVSVVAELQIDGGINAESIAAARSAGVDWFVVASAIFDKPDRKAAIAELRSKLQ